MAEKSNKQKVASLFFQWFLVTVIMLISILIAIIFNYMSWMGSHAFLKKYFDNSTIYAVSIMIFPSITLYVTLMGLFKFYSSLKNSVTQKLTVKDKD